VSFSEDEERVLKALAGGLLKVMGGGAGATGSSGEALEDHHLSQSWADKEIKKDPPRYSGPTMVGRRYSEAPSEWHESNAGFYEFKARKGREENPVRLKNNGKPWHEADTFEAKLCRAWGKRNAGRTLTGAPDPAESYGAGKTADDDVLPF
jgi:hypothetical protein